MEFRDVYPGMKVVIRQWGDMACEFGLRPTGTIDCPYGFHRMMKDTCGRVATILSIHEPDAFGLIIDGDPHPRVDSFHPCTFNPLTWEDVTPDKESKPLQLGKGD